MWGFMRRPLLIAILVAALATAMPLMAAPVHDKPPPPRAKLPQGFVWIFFGEAGGGTVTTQFFFGPGSGTITDAKDDVVCASPSASFPTGCVYDLTVGKRIRLTATPAPGSVFAGWGGPLCGGTAPTCDLTPSQNWNWVVAYFRSSTRTVTAGAYHTCSLQPTGTVLCWGLNHDGQLGFAASPSRSPTVIAGISNAVAVAAGGYHTCAIIADGTVRCWGNNDHGQLGDGTNNGSSTPVLVKGISGAVALTAGGYHTCARDHTSILCWGLNANGQLGDGTTQDRNTPVPLSWVFNTEYLITGIAAGGFHTCGIVDDLPSTATCWGMNNDGQLGFPYATGAISDPWEPAAGIRVQVKDPGCTGGGGCAGTTTFLPGVTAIAASIGVGQIGGTPLGGFHTVALDSSGLDWGWGYNADGELDGVVPGLLSPKSQNGAIRGIISSSGTPLTPSKIAAGAYHTCMSSAQAGVFCRGHNGNGESGPSPGTAVPMTVGAVDLAAGGYHTCAVVGAPTRANPIGSVICWGENGDGQVTGTPSGDVHNPSVVLP